jgi:hypothetical protein
MITKTRVASEASVVQLVPESWSALIQELTGSKRHKAESTVPTKLIINKLPFELVDVYDIQSSVRVKYEYARGKTSVYLYFEYVKSGKNTEFIELTVQVDGPKSDIIEAYDKQAGLGTSVNLNTVGSLITRTLKQGKKMFKTAIARVAGESRNIDANKVRELAEQEDDDGNGFNQKEVLSLVNHGNLKFSEVDSDYVNGGLLKWISFYMNKGGFRYRLTLDYKKGVFVGYECSAHPSFARSLEVEKKVKASNPIISASTVEELLNNVKLASKSKLSTIMKTPASFKLDRFNMETRRNLRHVNREHAVMIGFASKEVDSEKNPLVRLQLNATDGVIHALELSGSAFDVDNDEPTYLTEEGCSAALRKLLNAKYQYFEDIVRVLNSSVELSNILSELKPQRGREERYIGINVKNYTPISDRELTHPENGLVEEDSAYVIFKDAATRNTALDALRKVIDDHGGKIIYEDRLKIKDGA